MSNLARARDTYIYVPAVLRENKEWYLDYQYQLPDGSMKRARKYLNCVLKRFKTKAEKRAFALRECMLLNEKLRSGWTPEISRLSTISPKAATLMSEVYKDYRSYIEKCEREGNLRHETMLTYRSTMSILEEWTKSASVDRIYQMDEDAVHSWLRWAKEERHVGIDTQKNYKRWLRSFCTFCIERGYLKVNVASLVKITTTVQQKRKDERKFQGHYIEQHTREKIFEWLAKNDRNMLLACYLCYYCFIRPHEIMQLRIDNVELKRGLIFIPHQISKNDSDGWVTLPDEVGRLMIDLKIFDYPGSWRIFNRQLVPGPMDKADRGDALRDHWVVMRKELNIPDRVRMYDLKHTGITDMLGKVSAPRAVQLQARHHSIEQTEEYVQTPPPLANDEIRSIK